MFLLLLWKGTSEEEEKYSVRNLQNRQVVQGKDQLNVDAISDIYQFDKKQRKLSRKQT